MPREEDFTLPEGTAHEQETAGGVSSVPRRFTAEELVACEKCRRGNAPTRMNCLYCGEPLPVTARSAELRRPTLKPLEEWEQGFNIVLLPRAAREILPDVFEDAALLLRLEASRLREIVAARRVLPLARASSPEEVGLILQRLGALGFDAEVFSDEALSKPPARLRALSLDGDALVCWPSFDAEPGRLPWAEVALLVTGRIVTRRVEVEERQAKLSSRQQVVETRELSSDASVLDIYPNAESDDAGFRILADGFDYSCLGERKGLLARDNFDTLVEALRERARAAAFDEEYARLRGLLSPAWPVSERTQSHGLRRERPGRLNTEAVTTISNETQFTRYARLRWRHALRGVAQNS